MSRPPSYAFVIALAILSGACASTGATPRPFPTPNPPSSSPPAASTPSTPSPTASAAPAALPTTAAIAYSVTGTALGLRGAPYRNGGADPGGFDCSGFVQYVFAQHGVFVPRKVIEQFQSGKDVASGPLEPGDLVFFTTVAPGGSHVGIALGGDEFVHAPSSTGIVRVERLHAPYWSTRFVGARRVL
jgi:cell wall-associated NlpC family hydrolase